MQNSDWTMPRRHKTEQRIRNPNKETEMTTPTTPPPVPAPPVVDPNQPLDPNQPNQPGYDPNAPAETEEDRRRREEEGDGEKYDGGEIPQVEPDRDDDAFPNVDTPNE
jgi:hypothetical protein